MTELTPKAVAYCLHEEGLVKEAYKDSVGVWTWAGGVTNASGHEVYPRYKDKPQSLERCLEVTIWLMRNRYLPAVLKQFSGMELTEGQLAVALSFHWNTGAISKADWVQAWREGKPASAKAGIMNWSSRGILTARRKREQAIFFDNVWPKDLRCPIYPVSKPSYTPAFGKAELVDLMPTLEAMGGWA